MAVHVEVSEETIDKCMYITFGLILFSAVFERSLHSLERWISVYARYYVETVNVIYKELMMLGIISLFLTFLTALVSDEKWSLSFEFVHLALFISSMVHIILAVLMVIFGVKWCRFWKEGEKMGLKAVESKLESLHYETGWKFVFQNLNIFMQKNLLEWRMNFLIVREVFIWQNDLEDWFDFTMYIRKRVRAAVRHLVVIHYSVWVILLCILMVGLLAYKAEFRSGEESFIVTAWANYGLTIILYLKSRQMMKEFIRDHKTMHRRQKSEGPKRRNSTSSFYSALEEKSKRANRIMEMEGEVQRQIFWLGSPSTFRNSVQFVLLFHSLWLAVYVLYWASRFSSAAGHISAFVPVIFIAFMVTRILPVFSLMSSVGCLTCQQSLAESITKQRLLREEASKGLHVSMEAGVAYITPSIVTPTKEIRMGSSVDRQRDFSSFPDEDQVNADLLDLPVSVDSD